MKKPLLIIGVLIIVGILVLVGGSWAVIAALSPVASSGETIAVTIKSGSDVDLIARDLDARGVIRSAFAFKVYVWSSGLSSNLQAGDYLLAPTLDTPEIVRAVTQGDSQSNEMTIRLLEAWSNQEMGDYFESQGIFTAAAWKDAAGVSDSRTILPDLTYPRLTEKPPYATLEGFLYPDTYRIFRTAKPADVVAKMLENFEKKITPELIDSAAARGTTLYDTLILASIVEREVRGATDQRRVADVFLKRLRDGIPLQSDATVNYVTGKYATRPTFDDTAVDSLYNTYKYAGLPPGPIGNPSRAAIQAVLDPEPNPYYFFLTAKDGTTVFSRTLDEHNANKARYLGP